VEESATPLSVPERWQIGIAATTAAISLVIGLLRSWLRLASYRLALAELDEKRAVDLEQKLTQVGGAIDAKIDRDADQLYERLEGKTDEERKAALLEFYGANPNSLKLSVHLSMTQATALLQQLRESSRVRWLTKLQPVQLVFFIVGALSLSLFVLGRVL
jgi:hypothetical protein